MAFKVVNKLNPIGAMKTFTKPNCNLFIEESLTILKKLHDKHVTIMNNIECTVIQPKQSKHVDWSDVLPTAS